MPRPEKAEGTEMTDRKTPEPEGEFDETPDGKVRRRKPAHKLEQAPGEHDGRNGPEPTRYGDWEKKGIVSDF